MSNKCLLNLLLSHIVTALMYITVITIELFPNEQINFPNINGSATMIIWFALIVLAIDKLVCIKYPFHYQNLPKWLSYLMMSLCWVIGTIYLIIGKTFSSVNSIKTLEITYAVIGAVVAIVLLVSNTLIYKETQRHIKEISVSITSNIEVINTTVLSNNNIQRTGALTIDSNNTTELRKRFIQKKEIRAAYICISMATSYIILWIPFLVVTFVHEFRTKTNLEITFYIGTINSIADPVIYISFNRIVRSNINKRLTRMFKNF